MKPDSLIFDMDGTLWDAVDTYAHCWNLVFESLGLEQRFTHADLVKYMGTEAKKIVNLIFPEATDEEVDEIFRRLAENIDANLPIMGGKLYPGVIEGLHKLATKYKLFMLSNCQKNSIGDFIKFTKTENIIIDYIEHGMNHQPKHINIHTLMEKHGLTSPEYVGDTDSDRVQCDMAGVPFIFVDFGFGKSDSYKKKFSSFDELTDYYMSL